MEAVLIRPLAPFLLLALALVIACGGGGSGPTPAPKTAEETAERFLSLWKAGKYEEMYGFLSKDAAAATDKQKFIDRYGAIKDEARITDLDYKLGPQPSDRANKFAFSVTFHTSFFGDIKQDNAMPLVKEQVPLPPTPGEQQKTQEQWRINW